MSAGGRRVLVVLHEHEIGGASTAVLRCVEGLESRGWRFSFWVPRPSPLFDRLRAAGAEVDGAERPIAYSLAGLRLAPGPAARMAAAPGYLRRFSRALDTAAPDLVHANSHVTLAELCVAKARRVPGLFHVHEIFGDGPKWDLGRRLAFGAAREVVAVSRACADRLEFGRRRARVVRNGVELPAARAEPTAGAALTIGTVGVISRRKGTDVLVEAARIAADRDPRLRFEIVGAASEPLDAAWAESVLAAARSAGVGHLDRADVAAKLAEWDIFALPSRRDPFPLSMLEAMAAGLPVIGSAVDGIAEQVAAGTGTLVPPDDPAALADAIVATAALSPAERGAIGAAARARVGREFSLEAQVEGLDAAYRAAVGT